MTLGIIIAGIFGFFTGGLAFILVGSVTFWVTSRNRSPLLTALKKVESLTEARERPQILKVKSEAEEAWEAIQIQNHARGGITEQELKNL